MSDWRDADGNTAADRRKQNDAAARTHFLDRVRNRPLSLLKPALSALFVGLLIVALLTALR